MKILIDLQENLLFQDKLLDQELQIVIFPLELLLIYFIFNKIII